MSTSEPRFSAKQIAHAVGRALLKSMPDWTPELYPRMKIEGGGQGGGRGGRILVKPSTLPLPDSILSSAAAAAVAPSTGPQKDGQMEQPEEESFLIQMRHSPITITGPGVPIPPHALNARIHISMPSGKCNGMTFIGESGAIRRRRISGNDEDGNDSDNSAQQPAVAKTMREYAESVKPLIDTVLETLPKSNYLGFNPLRCGWEDSMEITVGGNLDTEGRVFDVRINGSHTDGWGLYAEATGKWSHLRHKHRCVDRNEQLRLPPVFDGLTTELFEDESWMVEQK